MLMLIKLYVFGNVERFDARYFFAGKKGIYVILKGNGIEICETCKKYVKLIKSKMYGKYAFMLSALWKILKKITCKSVKIDIDTLLYFYA